MEAAGESMESRSRRTMRERNIRCAGGAGRGRGEARRGGCPGPIKPSPSAGGEGLGRLGFRGVGEDGSDGDLEEQGTESWTAGVGWGERDEERTGKKKR